MSLADYSDEDLRKELDERSKNIWRQFKDWLEANVDILLTQHTEHSRNSCSDKDLANRFLPARCTRCFLLAVKENGYHNESWLPHYNPGYFTFTEMTNGNE